MKLNSAEGKHSNSSVMSVFAVLVRGWAVNQNQLFPGISAVWQRTAAMPLNCITLSPGKPHHSQNTSNSDLKTTHHLLIATSLLFMFTHAYHCTIMILTDNKRV